MHLLIMPHRIAWAHSFGHFHKCKTTILPTFSLLLYEGAVRLVLNETNKQKAYPGDSKFISSPNLTNQVSHSPFPGESQSIVPTETLPGDLSQEK